MCLIWLINCILLLSWSVLKISHYLRGDLPSLVTKLSWRSYDRTFSVAFLTTSCLTYMPEHSPPDKSMDSNYVTWEEITFTIRFRLTHKGLVNSLTPSRPLTSNCRSYISFQDIQRSSFGLFEFWEHPSVLGSLLRHTWWACPVMFSNWSGVSYLGQHVESFHYTNQLTYDSINAV